MNVCICIYVFVFMYVTGLKIILEFSSLFSFNYNCPTKLWWLRHLGKFLSSRELANQELKGRQAAQPHCQYLAICPIWRLGG